MNLSNSNHAPIIIIAAGRSGTKILRDMLCTHSKLVTWPCDEINPIWRYGNARYPTDELKPEHATPRIKKYIRSKFSEIPVKYGGERVVEKTCANSLRVEYVYEIFPEAQFIHLVRDGRDSAASAKRRWRTEDELSYVLKKGRWIPLLDVPYYAFKFMNNHLYRLFNTENKMRTWGPRFAGIDELVRTKSLIEVCGIQWAKCVEAARRGFENIPSSQVLEMSYETVVRDPSMSFARIFEFLGLEFEDQSRSIIQHAVSDSNIGKWRGELTQDEIVQLTPHIQSLLIAEGYTE